MTAAAARPSLPPPLVPMPSRVTFRPVLPRVIVGTLAPWAASVAGDDDATAPVAAAVLRN